MTILNLSIGGTDELKVRVRRPVSRKLRLFWKTTAPVRQSWNIASSGAVGYAPGAYQWMRDAISVFEEYDWDWTYHAFREWAGWDVEKEADDPGADHPAQFHHVEDTPRKRALLEGFARRRINSP